MDMINHPDWTSDEFLANLAAEELRGALDDAGIATVTVYVGEDENRVIVVFNDIKDAETMMSIGVPVSQVPGTLYDRASGACVGVAALVETDTADEENVANATEEAWFWNIHPHLEGRRAGWHASVYMAVADATQVAANLNALRWQA